MSLLHILNFDSVPTLHENKIIKFPNEHTYERCKYSMLLYSYAKSGLFIMSYTKYNLFMYIICHKYLCY